MRGTEKQIRYAESLIEKYNQLVEKKDNKVYAGDKFAKEIEAHRDEVEANAQKAGKSFDVFVDDALIAMDRRNHLGYQAAWVVKHCDDAGKIIEVLKPIVSKDPWSYGFYN